MFCVLRGRISDFSVIPGNFRMLVAFSGVKTQSATLAMVRDVVAAAGIAGRSNGWLTGLGLLAFDGIQWVSRVQA